MFMHIFFYVSVIAQVFISKLLNSYIGNGNLYGMMFLIQKICFYSLCIILEDFIFQKYFVKRGTFGK